jgi:hypothetical protein
MREEFAKRSLSWPELTSQDLTDLLVYLRNLPDMRDAAVRVEISSGAEGAALFRSRGFEGCHTGSVALPVRHHLPPWAWAYLAYRLSRASIHAAFCVLPGRGLGFFGVARPRLENTSTQRRSIPSVNTTSVPSFQKISTILRSSGRGPVKTRNLSTAGIVTATRYRLVL